MAGKDDQSGSDPFHSGHTRVLGEGDLLSTPCGSLHYAAPEVLAGRPHDAAADMFSLGCTLYEWMTTEPLFETSDDKLEQLIRSRSEACGGAR